MNNDVLLAPMAHGAPCGEDLSFSIEFDQIAEMRREDDPTLSQGDWVTALKVADWQGVARQCQALLAERTKDLRLAQWLTEALALTEGYAGLHQGLALCTALCTNHWADLHPQPDHDDMDQRVGNMTWFLQRLVALAVICPVTRGRQGQRLSLQDLQRGHHWQTLMERSPDEAQRHGAASAPVTVEQFMRALRETPRDDLRATLQAVRDCENQLLAWQAVIDAQLGLDGPSFVAAKDALGHAVHEIERLAREVGALAAIHATAPLDDEGDREDMASATETAGAEARNVRGPLRNRSHALEQLREVAAFFRRTEPHSPVAYLAEKAIKWGEMPLHEWLRKVVKDEGSMSHLHELLGIEPNDHPPAY